MPALAAAGVTTTVVGAAVAVPHLETAASHSTASLRTASSAELTSADAILLSRTAPSLSRTAKRVVSAPLPKVTGHEYASADLNIWPTPFEKGKTLGEIPVGTRLNLTGNESFGFAQIVRGEVTRWVNAAYISADKPLAAPAGISFAPCPDGSSTEYRLTPNAVRVFRAVCNAFPALTTYGGWAARGEHASGRAVDFMTNGDTALGQAIATWARAHASELYIYDVLWQQHIWTPVRSSEGWRLMPDRGSPTANHMDHVHISVY